MDPSDPVSMSLLLVTKGQCNKSHNYTILRENSLAISYNGFSLGDIFSIESFLLACLQTCQLFEIQMHLIL